MLITRCIFPVPVNSIALSFWGFSQIPAHPSLFGCAVVLHLSLLLCSVNLLHILFPLSFRPGARPNEFGKQAGVFGPEVVPHSARRPPVEKVQLGAMSALPDLLALLHDQTEEVPDSRDCSGCCWRTFLSGHFGGLIGGLVGFENLLEKL